jgi:hypothetical protein
MLALTRALGERDLAGLRSSSDAVFFSAFGQLITYPMWLAWPLAGLSVAILTALAVLARRRGEVTVPRLLLGAAAASLPIVVSPLAAIGLWQVLIAIRPGYATLFMGDPYRPHFYRWAIGSTYGHDLADLVPRAASPHWTCKSGDRSVDVAHGPRCG